MVLRNYKNVCLSMTNNLQHGSSIKNINGNAIESIADNHDQYGGLISYGQILVGSGTTEAQSSDYCLGTDITSSLTSVNISRGFQPNANGELEFSISQTFRNDTANDITITEYGIRSGIYFRPNTYPVLYTKEVLDAQNYIVLAPTQSVTITAVLK